MPDVFVELRAVISEFQEKMVIAREEMEKTSKSGSGHFSTLSKASGLAMAAVAGGAVAVGVAAVKMGNELEDAHVKMVTAIRDTGGNMAALSPKINAADKAMENFGFTNTQTENAIAVGTTALGSSSKALSILTTAANLAAYKHIDLATAEVAVAKGTEGNLRPLKQLGIDLPVVASSAEKVAVAQRNLTKAQQAVHDLLVKYPGAASAASKENAKYETAVNKVSDAQYKLSNLQQAGGDILAALNKRMGGQAAAAADTFSGKMEVARARVEDLGAKFGLVLIPVIIKVVGWLTTATNWLLKHKTVLEVLGVTVATVGAIMVGMWIADAAAATAAFVAENLATLGIIAGLMALAAAAIYVATHWKQVWGDIKKVFDDAVGFLRTKFGTLALLILGPLAPLAILALHWQQVWSGIQTVIRNVIPPLLNWFRLLGDGFFNTIQGILAAGSHLPFVGKYFRQANDAVHDAHQRFDSELTGWANDASTAGTHIGESFAGGMQLALARQLPKVTNQANYMVAQTAKSMRFTAQSNSPSKLTIPIGESMADGIIVGIQNRMIAAQKAAGAIITTVGGGTGAGKQTGQFGGWAAAGQAMAASMYGWTGAEWVALNNVAMRESGWNPNAQNPTSTAYGIAQNIGGRSGYPDPSPAGQIAWMLAYIARRYKDPIGAWQHELSAGWYDRGGRLPPGLSLAYNATGRDEVIAPGGAHGMTIIVYVGGSVVTEQGIVNAIHTGLLEKQKRVPLGIKAG